jgi:hypothetical protein
MTIEDFRTPEFLVPAKDRSINPVNNIGDIKDITCSHMDVFGYE